MKETRIIDWFWFDAVSCLILIGGTGISLYFGFHPDESGLLSISGLGTASLGMLLTSVVSLGWLILCAFTDIFPSGIQSYCKYSIIKALVLFLLSVLWNLFLTQIFASSEALDTANQWIQDIQRVWL